MPGVEKLVTHLKDSNIPIAVGTSSPLIALKIKTASHSNLFNHFNAIVHGDDVRTGKPSPEIFLTAAKRISPDLKENDNFLVFEDAENGVEV